MTITKVIRVNGHTTNEIDELTGLIQHAVNTVNPLDLKKLLSLVAQNPGIVKTALKFI